VGQLPGLVLKRGVLVLALERQLREPIPEQWLLELILEQVW
jgi:hypothetical protein